jgi:hypothetical protein
MSQKLDAFYFDEHGNFRAVLHKLSSFLVPKDQVYYDPKSGEKGQLIVGDQKYDVGEAYWQVTDQDGKTVPDPSVLAELEKKK